MSIISRHLLADAIQGYRVISALWRAVKPLVSEGKRIWIVVQEETRTLPQNAKFHAMCADLSKSNMVWMGKRRNTAEWKVLLVSGHATATKEGCELVPGIEGEFVNLRESTALMSVGRGGSLIEYSQAFCAANDVALSDPEDFRNWGLM